MVFKPALISLISFSLRHFLNQQSLTSSHCTAYEGSESFCTHFECCPLSYSDSQESDRSPFSEPSLSIQELSSILTKCSQLHLLRWNFCSISNHELVYHLLLEQTLSCVCSRMKKDELYNKKSTLGKSLVAHCACLFFKISIWNWFSVSLQMSHSLGITVFSVSLKS